MLIQQAQRLLSDLEDIHRRMTDPVDDFEAYNDYYQDKVEGLIMKAQRRLERRIRTTPAVSLPNQSEETRLLDRLHAERLDILARMVQELRAENASLTSDLTAAWANSKKMWEELEGLKHKAEQYDAVVAALQVADGGRYRNDTIEALLTRLRRPSDDTPAGAGDSHE